MASVSGGRVGFPSRWMPEPTKPYDWQSNPFWSKLKSNWRVNPSNYLGDFKGYYKDWMDMFQSGLGAGNVDVGSAGLGLYDSPLLGQLTDTVSGNLADPKSSLAYGTAMDRLTGQEGAQRQALADKYAGWGRGSGVMGAEEAALGSSLAKQRADVARQTAMDAERMALENAFGLENMRGGFYESSKERELGNIGAKLQNAALQRDLLSIMSSGNPLGLMADMMKWQAGEKSGAQAAERANLGSLFGLYDEKQSAYDQEMQNYQNQMGFKNYLDFNQSPVQGYWQWGNNVRGRPTYGRGGGFGNYLGGA